MKNINRLWTNPAAIWITRIFVKIIVFRFQTVAIYVGLEHIDPDNLKIERKGKPEDVIGTKLKIYKGDIIFGKRRAYQRKVAVSDFEGIVSAHSMVLRANEK